MMSWSNVIKRCNVLFCFFPPAALKLVSEAAQHTNDEMKKMVSRLNKSI